MVQILNLWQLLKTIYTVPLETEPKKKTEAPEYRRDSTIKIEYKEEMSLAEEDVQRKEDVKSRQERGVKLFESSLKKETRQQMVLSKEKDDVSKWHNEERQVEPKQDINPTFTEYDAKKLEVTEHNHEEDFHPEHITVNQSEDISLSFVSLTLKESAALSFKKDIASPPEKTPTKKEISMLTYKKEAYTNQERKRTFQ